MSEFIADYVEVYPHRRRINANKVNMRKKRILDLLILENLNLFSTTAVTFIDVLEKEVTLIK